jgi:hypothetical protein
MDVGDSSVNLESCIIWCWRGHCKKMILYITQTCGIQNTVKHENKI